MTTELLTVSTTPGLTEILAGFDGLSVLNAPSLNRVKSLIVSEQPPAAIYMDDTRGTISEVWEVITLAQSRKVPLLLGLQSVGQVHTSDFSDAGIPVTSIREVELLAKWIAAQLGARKRAAARGQITIAVGSAKGGVGKTLVVATLAEGFRRRGLQVLVVDGDLSQSSIVSAFRIPSGFPSFFHLKRAGLGQFTPEQVRRHIYQHRQSGIDFLIGSDGDVDGTDLVLPEWQALTQAIRALPGYDVVIIDTGPDIKKRPYALDAVHNGGYLVVPVPPGHDERAGAGVILRTLQEQATDLSNRCFLLYQEPEKGVTVTVSQIAPLFGQQFPQVRVIGAIPRAPHQVSLANESRDRYLSPLDIAPHSRFSRAIYDAVDTLCQQIGMVPPVAKPKVSLWQKLRGEKPIIGLAIEAEIGSQVI